MRIGTPQSREQRRQQRAERIQEAWSQHYDELVSGEVTLAEILQHSDEKLMAVADRGLRLLKVGKYEQARKILVGLPLLDPYVPYFHLLLGLLYEKVREFEPAFAEYEQAIALCESMSPPGSLLPSVLLAQGKLLVREGNLQRALQLTQRVLSGEFPHLDGRLQREAQAMLRFLEVACSGSA